MAKFKVGDLVSDGMGVYKITKVDSSMGYSWKFVRGTKDMSHSQGGMISWADSVMKIANSVVANAKFKVGDRVNDSGTWGKIIEVIKKNARGEVIYGFAPESGPGKGFAYEILESKLSKNSVVANALGVAKNADDSLVNVTMDTITFAQGKKKETKTMKVDAFKVLLRKLGLGDEDLILRNLARGGVDIDLTGLLVAKPI